MQQSLAVRGARTSIVAMVIIYVVCLARGYVIRPEADLIRIALHVALLRTVKCWWSGVREQAMHHLHVNYSQAGVHPHVISIGSTSVLPLQQDVIP